MRPGNIAKRIRLVNLHIHLILDNKIKQFPRVPVKLLPRHNKVEQCRPHQPNILRAQPRNRERRHSTTRITKAQQTALARQAVQRKIESGLAHAVEDRDHAFAAGELVDALLHVFVRVVNHVARARFAREVDFLLRARRADGVGSHRLEQLAQPQPSAARGGVHKNPVALLDGVSFADERQGCEALQEGSGGDLRREVGGDLGRFGSGRGGVFGVGCFGEADYAVAGLQVVGFAGAGGDDGAFGFATEHVGPVGGWVEAGAEVAGIKMLGWIGLQLDGLEIDLTCR